MTSIQEPNSPFPARHSCHCGKSFARKEHLVRHQATHEQPAYVCNVCQRRFSRRELLRRHSVLHDPNRTRSVVSCDACRANKTKCSGGILCSLCARRGINCTFKSSNRRSKRPSTDTEFMMANGFPPEEHGNIDNESTLPNISRPQEISTGKSLHTEQIPLGHEWLRDLLIVPSKAPDSNVYRPVHHGVEAIHEVLLVNKSCLDTDVQMSDGFQEWLTSCLKSYFNHFHLRWPVLNAPSFDVTTATLPLAASVCVIGTWLNESSSAHEKLCALQIHELLLHRLIEFLVDPKSIPGGKAWPLEQFEAVLLTLIFSLHRRDKAILARARLLRMAFVTILREKEMLNAEVLAGHLKTHYTGSFAPYVLSMREQFKRLFAFTFQFDVYFALAHEESPLLHRQEIGADLMVTFALWNSYGLDIFARRLAEEPMDRTGIQISAMTEKSSTSQPSHLLVEDVVFGLCGMLQAIWVVAQPSSATKGGTRSNSFQRVLLIDTFDAWKSELDKIQQIAKAEQIESNVARYLWLAYRGEDENATNISERISALVHDGMLLCCLLKMYHYGGLRSSGHFNELERRDDLRIEPWWRTKDGREAITCAMQILKMADFFKNLGRSTNPLFGYALTAGANLIKSVLAQCENCSCLDNGGQPLPGADSHNSTEIDGPFDLNGTRFCACKLRVWLGEFEQNIRDQKALMEVIEDNISS